MSRSRTRLESLVAAGAEPMVGDLLDPSSLDTACHGVAQVFSTANSLMGAGAQGPAAVDVEGHRNLARAAIAAGVGRIVNVSAAGMSPRSPVDYFRVKCQVDDVIRGCGLPWVLLQPTAFMETWVSMLLGDSIQARGVATLFGDGQRVANFIAVDDVAAFAARILGDLDVQGEVVVGGPSNVTYEHVVELIERALGVTARRKHVPAIVLRLGRHVVRPFHEVAARMMSLGYLAASRDVPFEAWQENARRFGINPRTVEAYVLERYRPMPAGA